MRRGIWRRSVIVYGWWSKCILDGMSLDADSGWCVLGRRQRWLRLGREGAYMDLAKNGYGHGWNKCMGGGTGGRNRSIGTDYLSK